MSNSFAPPVIANPVVVTVDLHRGHLDPKVATMPLPAVAAARVTQANVEFLTAARRLHIPIVHVVTTFRDVPEIHSNPFWKAIEGTSATRNNMREHNFPGSVGTQLMPGLEGPGDFVVTTKKRYDSFLGTELQFVLHRLKASTLMITGVNTNSCVLATTIAAHTRDYAPIVISDCVDTLDGAEYHEKALDVLSRAFAWVLPWREVIQFATENGVAQDASRLAASNAK